MSEARTFGLVVLVTAGAGLLAVVSNRLGERVKVPLPAFFLAAAAIAQVLVSDLHAPTQRTAERIVTVALCLILFDGGRHIGMRRFRAAAGPILAVGVAGTFLTVAGAAVAAHLLVGVGWYPAVLLAAAIAPTDPAVVFSVLGRREIEGRASAILEGESGVNDPVGIALMTSLLAAGALTWHGTALLAGSFALEMAVGAVVGVAGGRALLWTMQRLPLPGEGLYPLRSLAAVFVLYGVAAVAHGSGFLAVFVAGIVTGDARAPYKREVERFHAALAGLGEIVAFVVLGLTVDLGEIARADVWLPGIGLGLVLAVIVRPVAVALCLRGARLPRNAEAFVLFAGLKGAVPILLGGLIVAGQVAGAGRLYGIVIVAVVLSVVAQGSLVPFVAHRLRLAMRTLEPEPWALGVRLRDEPDGVHRLTVAAGAPADGSALRDIPGLPGDAWISLVVRAGRLVGVDAGTRLEAGDEVLVLADSDLDGTLRAVFEG